MKTILCQKMNKNLIHRSMIKNKMTLIQQTALTDHQVILRFKHMMLMTELHSIRNITVRRRQPTVRLRGLLMYSVDLVIAILLLNPRIRHSIAIFQQWLASSSAIISITVWREFVEIAVMRLLVAIMISILHDLNSIIFLKNNGF